MKKDIVRRAASAIINTLSLKESRFFSFYYFGKSKKLSVAACEGDDSMTKNQLSGILLNTLLDRKNIFPEFLILKGADTYYCYRSAFPRATAIVTKSKKPVPHDFKESVYDFTIYIQIIDRPHHDRFMEKYKSSLVLSFRDAILRRYGGF